MCNSTVGHHMCADDNQLFISFVTTEFSANVSHLQAVDLVSQWMSPNLLSLNQSKTEFLLIDLNAQLTKISEPSLLMPSNAISTPTSFIFDSSLSMSDHIFSVFKVSPLTQSISKNLSVYKCC